MAVALREGGGGEDMVGGRQVWWWVSFKVRIGREGGGAGLGFIVVAGDGYAVG